ncbi:hypothetical protein DRE_06678 [Drechslerella stenobrocha 248]|uniref:Phospholipid/glycerol acyltransferase domain-containing protein n=1 Tax=Drechslerella stenobrocha 248 TaxID=1043628 RepID=W7HWY6_9PEZI|nr:hypothetical protein DRE_06678 [Drechslerella stenobrocha 248]
MATPPPKSKFPKLNPWTYDILIWFFTVLIDLFFREVHPRGAYRIPKRGPIIFVAAPHANQFVDPVLLMRSVKLEAGRRIAFLVAEKSMRRKFVGFFAGCAGAVSVSRALDMTRPASGKIYLPNPEDLTLIRGEGTKFTSEASIGGLLVLPTPPSGGSAASAEILEIISDEEIRLKKEFKGDEAYGQITGKSESGRGTKYKVAPKVDQSEVYDAVFQRLNEGECVGIFPEGGSHDRTELLPLKAGVAIMALGALAANPDSDLKIIPCGMNYFHPNKFRSRAVIEFGSPIDVPPELVKQYQSGEKREAVRVLLEIIYNALVAVTVTSPDYETLMVIQAARRLYRPTNKKLPLPYVVELNRRLVAGYTHYKDDPRIIKLKDLVLEYNKDLRLMGLRDHQVEYAKFSILQVIGTLLYRTAKLSMLALAALPGAVLFAPVFVATRYISHKRAKEALKASTVKINAKDVIASWKLLVALAFAPSLYSFYTFLLTYWAYRHRIWGNLPDWVPLWLVVVFGYCFFPAITFAALRIGEVGMDIFKSLRPLVLSLNPGTANTLFKLRQRREDLAVEVANMINILGPELFPDFDNKRIIADPFLRNVEDRTNVSDPQTPVLSRRGSQISDHNYSDSAIPDLRTPSMSTTMLNALSRNESFSNLGSIGLFASRPVSRARSRSNSNGGFHIKAFSTLDHKASFEEVNRRLVERRKERSRRQSESEEKEEYEEESDDDTVHLNIRRKKTV